jgi:hypothetical protein
MTVTDLREALQKLEAAGHGSLRIAVTETTYDESFMVIPFAPEVRTALRSHGDKIDDGKVVYIGTSEHERPALENS